jgi:predicted nucleic acid-binding protein
MPYADSNFFLALIKKQDWLNESAEKLLDRYKGEIWTSEWALIEILMLTEKFGLDPENVVNSILQLAKFDGNTDLIRSVAHLMKDEKMRTFDALHAVSCKGDSIISSDPIFDKVGLKRIKLEK